MNSYIWHQKHKKQQQKIDKLHFIKLKNFSTEKDITKRIKRQPWNNAICSNMDTTRDYHTKWHKSERERQIPYDITYMWNLKYDTNEPIYETETESQT